jgi:Bacterial regulatory proteins, luxR family
VRRQLAAWHATALGQVAQALFISSKTASVHVSNILAKLGRRVLTVAGAGVAVKIGRAAGAIPGLAPEVVTDP